VAGQEEAELGNTSPTKKSWHLKTSALFVLIVFGWLNSLNF
jgi:hypothetical protein